MTSPSSSSPKTATSSTAVDAQAAAGGPPSARYCSGAPVLIAAASARRRRTRRRDARSRGTCRSSRRPATAARCRPARATDAAARDCRSMMSAIDTGAAPRERGRDQRRVAADQHRARAPCRGTRRRAARSPGPCRRRPRSARAGRRGPRSPRRSRRRWCPWNRRSSATPRRSATSCDAVRQAAEAPQHAGHRRARQPQTLPSASAASALATLWRPAARARASGSSGSPRLGEPSCAVLASSRKSAPPAAQAEADAALSRARHAHDDRVVEIDDRGRAALEDARLRRGVLGDVA